MCLFGCGVSTGLGAVLKTCNMEEGASVAVFGLGAVGLAVIQAARLKKARRIFAVCMWLLFLGESLGQCLGLPDLPIPITFLPPFFVSTSTRQHRWT